METELTALKNNGTWVMVDLPPNVIPISYKWVYTVTHKDDSFVEWFKARMVAKDYNQMVAKLTIVIMHFFVRMLLSLSSIHNRHLHKLEVNNAFLHGE